MTPQDQLDLWVKGENVHNQDRGECCPDFACCCKDNHWPISERLKFAKVYKEGGSSAVEPLLLKSLGPVLGKVQAKTYVSGSYPLSMH